MERINTQVRPGACVCISLHESQKPNPFQNLALRLSRYAPISGHGLPCCIRARLPAVPLPMPDCVEISAHSLKIALTTRYFSISSLSEAHLPSHLISRKSGSEIVFCPDATICATQSVACRDDLENCLQ